MASCLVRNILKQNKKNLVLSLVCINFKNNSSFKDLKIYPEDAKIVWFIRIF